MLLCHRSKQSNQRRLDSCTSASESGYEPINSNSTKTYEEEPKYLDYGDGMLEGRHNSTSLGEVSKEDKKVVNLSYEPLKLGNETKVVQPVSRDSMIDNTAYGMESYVSDMQPSKGIGGVVDRGEDQQQYEEVVVLENNSSYNCVTTSNH